MSVEALQNRANDVLTEAGVKHLWQERPNPDGGINSVTLEPMGANASRRLMIKERNGKVDGFIEQQNSNGDKPAKSWKRIGGIKAVSSRLALEYETHMGRMELTKGGYLQGLEVFRKEGTPFDPATAAVEDVLNIADRKLEDDGITVNPTYFPESMGGMPAGLRLEKDGHHIAFASYDKEGNVHWSRIVTNSKNGMRIPEISTGRVAEILDMACWPDSPKNAVGQLCEETGLTIDDLTGPILSGDTKVVEVTGIGSIRLIWNPNKKGGYWSVSQGYSDDERRVNFRTAVQTTKLLGILSGKEISAWGDKLLEEFVGMSNKLSCKIGKDTTGIDVRLDKGKKASNALYIYSSDRELDFMLRYDEATGEWQRPDKRYKVDLYHRESVKHWVKLDNRYIDEVNARVEKDRINVCRGRGDYKNGFPDYIYENRYGIPLYWVRDFPNLGTVVCRARELGKPDQDWVICSEIETREVLDMLSKTF